MHGTMNIMDKTGHSTTSWDPSVMDEVNAAKATFDRLTGKGYRAFKVGTGGDRGQELRAFDPAAAQMIMIPQLQGG